jgi:imidazole glycerol-phosphate synthase subunit HisH
MRITLFDYGAGNLHSLMKALAGPERDVRSETDPVAALATDVLVLPGVGAFGAAAARLAPGRAAMRDAILAGLPTLGICLGMQLLFESSEEGEGAGLAVLGGRVERLRARRLPQIGWNTLEAVREPLITTSGLTTAYYANGFVCRAADALAVTAWSTHEDDRFAAAVRVARCVGVQFHPEKSSTPGRLFVNGFLRALQQGALPPLSDS